MEHRSIGLIETTSVAKGVESADEMIKAASVELIMARPACPGKYLAMVSGEVGAVQNSVDAGRRVAGEFLVDTFVIPNVHPAVFPALSALTQIRELNALGIIETFSVASAIMAADAAVKEAEVELIEVRCATGLAGKSFLMLTGDVGSVDSAVQAGLEAVRDSGLILSHVIIPSPSPELFGCLC